MKLKLFTFRFSESSGGFNDEPLQKFIADKEVVEFTNHFFVHEKIPYLTVILSYRDISRDERQKGNLYREFRNDLDERETKAYDALRAWRAIKASQEGIPPYMIANNKQIAQMVKLQPNTKTDLAKVAGIGDAKKRIENYLERELCLKIKEEALVLAPISQGLSFLGFRIFPGVMRIQRRGWRRFRRKVQRRNEWLVSGEIDDEEWHNSMQSLVGHLRNASTHNLRNVFLRNSSRGMGNSA